MITADQIVAHCVGDYILQSDWMANKKRTDSLAALAHAAVYSLPFLFLLSTLPFGLRSSADGGHGSAQLSVIFVTHYWIDRYGLARYVVWAKNFLAPRWIDHTLADCGCKPICPPDLRLRKWRRTPPWRECSATGYPPDRPPFLAVWLLIIADNILHVLINGLALRYL